MRTRYFKSWVILLNLLAFNVYALNTAATFSLPARMEQHTSHAVQQNVVHNQACDETAVSIDQDKVHHCDMPCCKHKLKELTQARTCGCKLGNSGSMQLQNIGSHSHIYLDVASYVDAKPAALTLQDRTQRLLRPPIQ